MKKIVYLTVVMGLFVLLAGCETTGDEREDLSETQAGQDAGATPGGDRYDAQSQGLQPGSEYAAGSLDDPHSPLSKRVIYFLYDSAEISPEFIPVIDAHARYLASHPETRVTLEGHADERGSREYNIALGEQRAASVARKLEIQGVDPGQFGIVSYGEEKPVAFGHDEAAWQLNRRVEIRYPGY
ncbi:MAG: peptidoglycan-associated lipoprotein Pal [Gammaproteobacteria bacterium]